MPAARRGWMMRLTETIGQEVNHDNRSAHNFSMMTHPVLKKRTPRACEHCRQTRRRCETPYPCRQCVVAGIQCNVRAKARPQRRQQRCPKATTLRSDDHRGETSESSLLDDVGATHDKTQSAVEVLTHCRRKSPSRETQGDTYELLKALVQEVLLKQHGEQVHVDLRLMADVHRLCSELRFARALFV